MKQKSSVADDFERLSPMASKVVEVMEDASSNPQDAIFVLAMVASFIINTHRQEDVPLKDAQECLFGLVRGFSGLGEGIDMPELN